MTAAHTRRVVLTGLVVLLALGTSGCLTLQPTVSGPSADSAIFENISTSEPWSSGHVTTTVTLSEAATTDKGVTKLTVVDASGDSYDTTTLDSGQTTTTMFFPTNQSSTLLATNTVNGTVVEKRTVTTSGNKII
ncbi:hypothetical protein [Haloarcula amylovorans]|uniref:hypothetical protein n=1 Tax=Haloarcula amylovorans TaxID=2562280 RepID=UPI001076708C|nr:hypothetical protein [Halomicroarcula amylolytica]